MQPPAAACHSLVYQVQVYTYVGTARGAPRTVARERMRLVVVVCAAYCSQGEMDYPCIQDVKSHVSNFRSFNRLSMSMYQYVAGRVFLWLALLLQPPPAAAAGMCIRVRLSLRSTASMFYISGSTAAVSAAMYISLIRTCVRRCKR